MSVTTSEKSMAVGSSALSAVVIGGTGAIGRCLVGSLLQDKVFPSLVPFFFILKCVIVELLYAEIWRVVVELKPGGWMLIIGSLAIRPWYGCTKDCVLQSVVHFPNSPF